MFKNDKEFVNTITNYQTGLNVNCLKGGLRTFGLSRLKIYYDLPSVSIITVVRNGKSYLERCILSVLNQSYSNFEYIIIDGNSTDGTIDIIKKYNNRIDYWISESDRGIYDGMNKGIAMSRGNIINILNSDDVMNENAIGRIVELYKSFNSYQKYNSIICSEIEIIDENDVIMKASGQERIKWYWKSDMWGHPSWYVPRFVYEKYGIYDTNYKIVADRELYFRFKKNSIVFYPCSPPLAKFRTNGAHHQSIMTTIESFYVHKKYKGLFIAGMMFIISTFTKILSKLLLVVVGESSINKLRKIRYKYF